MASFAHRDAIHLGMDVHRDSISVGILNPGCERPDVEKIFKDEESVRRLIGRFDEPQLLRVCYEAGPTGFDLARLLRSMGVACEVIAPSLIPKAPGDKVKTDKRDCRRLARLHRAGELVAIGVPNPLEEAVRDLCRTRGDMVEDLTRARNRLSKFLLRHSRVYRDGSPWTIKHESWLAAQRFDEPAAAVTRVVTVIRLLLSPRPRPAAGWMPPVAELRFHYRPTGRPRERHSRYLHSTVRSAVR